MRGGDYMNDNDKQRAEMLRNKADKTPEEQEELKRLQQNDSGEQPGK